MKFTNTATAVAALLPVCIAATSAEADNKVRLFDENGNVAIEGSLLEFSDGVYKLSTNLGDLLIQQAGLTCEGQACPVTSADKNRIALGGASSIAIELMPLVVQGYAAKYGAEPQLAANGSALRTDIRLIGEDGFGEQIAAVSINGSVSDEGLRALLGDGVDIAMSSRRITPDEAKAFRVAGTGSMVGYDSEMVFALDSLAVVVHPDNPVQSLTEDQLGAIYSSQITNWSELGGPDQPINVYARTRGTGARYEFDASILGEPNSDLRAPTLQFVAGEVEMASAVFEDVNALGYVGQAFIRGTKPVGLTNACGQTNFPTTFATKTEEYPLTRRMYLYNKAQQTNDRTTDLLDFAMSADADSMIEKSGFVSLSVTTTPLTSASANLQDRIAATDDSFEIDELRRMQEFMQGWQRLSTTFRFSTGSTRLDAKGQRDLERLVDYLNAAGGSYDVAVVGFTDDQGAYSGNVSVAQDRAEAVREMILAGAEGRLSKADVVATGFGPAAPVTCNATEQGRAVNRRVEVWIR